MIDSEKLKARAYQCACEHGFHEVEQYDSFYLALIMSEIGEAINADRHNYHAVLNVHYGKDIIRPILSSSDFIFKIHFENLVKDTVEDELADIAIRILDLTGLREYDIATDTSIELANISFIQFCYTMFNTLSNDDGLSKEWKGRVWLNPTYSRPLIEQFVCKMAEHNNGIALLFNRCDSKMFQDVIFEKASAMLFMRKRIRFYRPDGTRGNSPGCGSVLIAFGLKNAEILKNSGIQGKFVWLNK